MPLSYFVTLLLNAALSLLNGEDLAPAEKEYIDLINLERAAVGRPLVEANAHLARIARSHSAELVKDGYWSDRSPKTGTPRDRIQAARIAASRVVEHLAKETSPGNAHKKLMDDEKYRNNILDRDLNRGGVGMVPDGQGNFVMTILLIQPIIAQNPVEAARTLLENINSKRRTLVAPELKPAESLNRLSHQICQRMNKEGDLFVGDWVKAELPKLGLSYKTYRSFYRFTKDLDTVMESKHLYDPRYRLIGIGLLTNESDEQTFGGYWVAILLIEPK